MCIVITVCGASTSVPEGSRTGAATPPVVLLAVGVPRGCGAPWCTALRWRPDFPVLRGWTHLHELLDAIRLKDDNDIQVIVVDDASSDGGVTEVRTRRPIARIVAREVNGGFAAAVNSSVEVASRWVAVIADPDLLASLANVCFLANSEDASPMTVFARRVLTRARNEQIIGYRWLTPWNSARDLFHADFFRRCVGVRPLNVSDDEYCPDWVVAACLAVRIDCLLSEGPFDQSYFTYGEEVDWQRRDSLQADRREFCANAV